MGEGSKTKPLKDIRNIGIIAHIDAGKTTVTERILFVTGKTYKMGEVHDGEAVMDYMVQEQERGITITSAVTSFNHRHAEIHLIDTPGHVDFTVEVERSLRVLDGAVVVFDAVNGVESQSETVWNQADKYNVPRIAFINKMDKVGADFFMAVESMRQRFRQRPVPIQLPLGSEQSFEGVVDLISLRSLRWSGDDPRATLESDEIPAQLKEDLMKARQDMLAVLGEYDDEIADAFLSESEISREKLVATLRRLCIEGKVVPVLCGSALRNKGIPPLLDAVVDFLPSPLDIPPVQGIDPRSGEIVRREPDPKGPLCALAFKVQVTEEGRRLVYVRIYSGTISEKQDVYNATRGVEEKVSRVFAMHAKERKRLEFASAANIVGVLGLKTTSTGDTLCDKEHPIVLERISDYEPVMSMAIEPESRADKEKLEQVLQRIADEDPTFRTMEDKETGETLMSGMGELHLEIIADRIRRDFGVPVRTGKPQVLYAETVISEATGSGTCEIETEEAKVFALCEVKVVPGERGAGVKFVANLDPVIYYRNFQEAAKEGVINSLKGGIVHGWPITDVVVELLKVESKEGFTIDETAVKIAIMNAVKDACERAGMARLAPIAEIEVICPSEFLGDVLATIQARRGVIEAIEDRDKIKVVRATAPIERMFGYATDLRSATEGRGSFTMRFSRYDIAF